MIKTFSTVGVIVLTLFSFCASGNPAKREMRGTWIATVFNIDWPSSPQLSIAAQQQELVNLLNELKECKLNTVILQVRPNSDAFYISSIEPPSHWSCGSQNRSLGYDPLQFAIEQCRQLGLSVHVWINPYRAWNDMRNLKALAKEHLFYSNPELFIRVENTLYFNPALEESREHLCEVVKELILNYDIDAIHMDDYFYPYPRKDEDLEDKHLYLRNSRGFTSIEDWRRDNVNIMVRNIRRTIDLYNAKVEFGISPFGVWRNSIQDPKGSDTKSMFSNYDTLYADVLLWMNSKWVDYIVPQIYWDIGNRVADYATLVDWWSEHSKDIPLYIGHAVYKIDPKSSDNWKSAQEIVRQVTYNRKNKNVSGSIFFSAKWLRRDHRLGLSNILRQNVYDYYTLPPERSESKSITSEKPKKAVLRVLSDSLYLKWEPTANNRSYVIYRIPRGKRPTLDDPRQIVHITGKTEAALRNNVYYNPTQYTYYITALSPSYKETSPLRFRVIRN